jgi:hypothetical protein
MRFTFFLINCSIATLLFLSAAVHITVGVMGRCTPVEFVGAGVLAGPFIAFGVAEWMAYVRDRRSWELPLGVACLCASGVLAAGIIISNLYEAFAGSLTTGSALSRFLEGPVPNGGLKYALSQDPLGGAGVILFLLRGFVPLYFGACGVYRTKGLQLWRQTT